MSGKAVWLSLALLLNPWALVTLSAADAPTIKSVTPALWLPGVETVATLKGTGFDEGMVLLMTLGDGQPPTLITPFAVQGSDTAKVRLSLPAGLSTGPVALRLQSSHGFSPLAWSWCEPLPPLSLNVSDRRDAPTVWDRDGVVEFSLSDRQSAFFRLSRPTTGRRSLAVLSRGIGAPGDPVVRLFDSQGNERVFIDDCPGHEGDVVFAIPDAWPEELLLEVRDVRFQAGRFRVRLGDFPNVSTTFPLAVSRGAPNSLEPAGRLQPEPWPVGRFTLPSTLMATKFRLTGEGWEANAGPGLSINVMRTSGRVELEPNDHPARRKRGTSGPISMVASCSAAMWTAFDSRWPSKKSCRLWDWPAREARLRTWCSRSLMPRTRPW